MLRTLGLWLLLGLAGCPWLPSSGLPATALTLGDAPPVAADRPTKTPTKSAATPSADVPVAVREILAKDVWSPRPQAVQPGAPATLLRWQYEPLEELLAQPEPHRPDLRPLLKDPQPVVAGNAAIGLARLDDPSAAPRLAETVRIPTLRLEMRRAAIEALAGLEHPPRNDLLRELLQQYGQYGNRSTRYVPELHVELLRGLARHPEASDKATFLAALRSPGAEVRREGVLALAALPLGALPVEVADLRTDPDARVRASCLTSLAQHRAPQAEEYLTAALDDTDLSVRLAVVAALGTLPSDSARKLLRAELSTPSELIRAAVVTALGAAGDRQAVLDSAGDKLWRVRLAVAKALLPFPDPESAAVLQKYLQDPSVPVEQQAIATLGQWPLELAGPILLEGMARTAYTARKAAAEQLAERWPAAARFSADAPPQRRSEILEQLQHEFRQQIGAADTRPGMAAEKGVSPQLLARVEGLVRQVSDPASEKGARDQAIAEFQALGASGIDALEELVFGRQQPLPAAVYHHLLPAADPVFLALDRLTSDDVRVRRRGAADLAERAGKRPLRRLAVARLADAMATESDPLVWQSVLTAVGGTGSEGAVRLAAIALGHPSPEVRRRACEYLEAHPAADHAPLLLPLLQDGHEEVVLAAARALGTVGNVDDLAPLRQRLAARSEQVQLEVAIALTRLGDETGAAALERLSYSGDESVRRRVAVAMGETPNTAYLPVLRGFLDDKKQSVRLAALAALPKVVGHDVPVPPGQPAPHMAERVELWKRWFQERR